MNSIAIIKVIILVDELDCYSFHAALNYTVANVIGHSGSLFLYCTQVECWFVIYFLLN